MRARKHASFLAYTTFSRLEIAPYAQMLSGARYFRKESIFVPGAIMRFVFLRPG